MLLGSVELGDSDGELVGSPVLGDGEDPGVVEGLGDDELGVGEGEVVEFPVQVGPLEPELHWQLGEEGSLKLQIPLPPQVSPFESLQLDEQAPPVIESQSDMVTHL